MPFTGSAKTLEEFLIQEMYAEGLISLTDPPDAQANMKTMAKVIGAAAEKWILAAGPGSITGTIAPGQVVAGVTSPAVVATPGTVTAATTSPGTIVTAATGLV